MIATSDTGAEDRRASPAARVGENVPYVIAARRASQRRQVACADMDIDTYARRHPQLAYGDVEPHLVEWLAKGGFHSVLDVGCGNGRIIAGLLEDRLLEGARILAVDLSESNITGLNARLPEVEATVDNA